MNTWHCPRCTYTTRQRALVTAISHNCQPPGHPLKRLPLHIIDTDLLAPPASGETNTQQAKEGHTP